MKLEVGIDIYILLYMEWMCEKDLLYSTGKSIQYSVVTQMGKESEKEWIYVCVCIYIHIYIYNLKRNGYMCVCV